MLAMVAAQDGEIALCMREFPLFDVFDPGAVNPEGDLVLFFAGHAAGMAADTFAMVDQETEFHMDPCRWNMTRLASDVSHRDVIVFSVAFWSDESASATTLQNAPRPLSIFFRLPEP
jgi:hypothetical protein